MHNLAQPSSSLILPHVGPVILRSCNPRPYLYTFKSARPFQHQLVLVTWDTLIRIICALLMALCFLDLSSKLSCEAINRVWPASQLEGRRQEPEFKSHGQKLKMLERCTVLVEGSSRDYSRREINTAKMQHFLTASLSSLTRDCLRPSSSVKIAFRACSEAEMSVGS